MSGPVLRVQGLRAGFGPTTVLHGVDLAVGAGEVAVLLGLNGAGKSVTLRVVAGLVPAWDGSVHLEHDDITALSAEARVGRGMAHVTQGRHVFPDLSVEENLRLGAYTLRRRDRRRYAPVLESVLDRFPRLGERRDQPAGTMSGGEQAMLAVGRALMADPRVILVDEPSAGLAPAAADALVDTLRAVHASGVSMLLVEQNVTFALELADRVHVMRQGTVVHAAPRDELDHDRLTTELGIGRLLKGGAR